MARVSTHQDAYTLINALYEEITGQKSTIVAQDTSSFISVGETILTYGTEKILNGVGIVSGKRMADNRPYTSQFIKVRAENSGIYTTIKGTINYYASKALEDGSINQTGGLINFKEGFDNGYNPDAYGQAQSAGSMWEQHPAKVVNFWFSGSSTWQDCITRYDDQIQQAFRSEEDFLNFWQGVMVEKGSDIEQQKEAFDRASVLNFMAGIYDLSSDMVGSAVNLTSEFNNTFGTNYSSDQLLSTYIVEFSEFLASKIKDISDAMTDRSTGMHWTVPTTAGDVILRHTPKANQNMLFSSIVWNKVGTLVKPQVFNPDYLDIGNFTPVRFWQNEQIPLAIDVTPAIPDTTTPTAQTTGNRVQLGKVLGLIYDDRALLTDYQLEDVSTTEKEARKHYRNTWFTFRRNAINNFTHKAVLLYMAD